MIAAKTRHSTDLLRSCNLQSLHPAGDSRPHIRRPSGAATLRLLATTALCLPSIAIAGPAPAFVDIVDDHGVNLSTGMPSFSMEEGGIGSGPGRVALHRIYVENEGWTDNWSGGAYPITDANNVTKMYVQFGGYSDSFSGSGRDRKSVV